MRRLFFVLLLFVVALACQSCLETTRTPPKTPLELAAIQSREYDTSKRVAFDSVMTVFQDLGYIIISADFNTGFITAKSPTRSGAIVMGLRVEDNEMRDTKATAFIQEVTPTKTRIRLNFVNSVEMSAKYGQRSVSERPVEEPALYQNAFTRINEAIFIKTETR